MAVAERLHVVEEEAGGSRFVWIDAQSRSVWDRARSPVGADDIRQIEDIALAELAIARRLNNDPIDVARRFGVRRLSSTARTRIELA